MDRLEIENTRIEISWMLHLREYLVEKRISLPNKYRKPKWEEAEINHPDFATQIFLKTTTPHSTYAHFKQECLAEWVCNYIFQVYAETHQWNG